MPRRTRWGRGSRTESGGSARAVRRIVPGVQCGQQIDDLRLARTALDPAKVSCRPGSDRAPHPLQAATLTVRPTTLVSAVHIAVAVTPGMSCFEVPGQGTCRATVGEVADPVPRGAPRSAAGQPPDDRAVQPADALLVPFVKQ